MLASLVVPLLCLVAPSQAPGPERPEPIPRPKVSEVARRFIDEDGTLRAESDWWGNADKGDDREALRYLWRLQEWRKANAEAARVDAQASQPLPASPGVSLSLWLAAVGSAGGAALLAYLVAWWRNRKPLARLAEIVRQSEGDAVAPPGAVGSPRSREVVASLK